MDIGKLKDFSHPEIIGKTKIQASSSPASTSIQVLHGKKPTNFTQLHHPSASRSSPQPQRRATRHPHVRSQRCQLHLQRWARRLKVAARSVGLGDPRGDPSWQTTRVPKLKILGLQAGLKLCWVPYPAGTPLPSVLMIRIWGLLSNKPLVLLFRCLNWFLEILNCTLQKLPHG